MSDRLALGFDFGTVRIGVAVGNGITQSAQALAVVDARTNRAKWPAIEKLVAEWSPSVLVVGVPRHPDGQPHEVTRRALRFARQLEGRFGLEVDVVDERYSSVEAGGTGGVVDDLAAAVILQQWFDEGQPVRPPQAPDKQAGTDAGKENPQQ